MKALSRLRPRIGFDFHQLFGKLANEEVSEDPFGGPFVDQVRKEVLETVMLHISNAGFGQFDYECGAADSKRQPETKITFSLFYASQIAAQNSVLLLQTISWHEYLRESMNFTAAAKQQIKFVVPTVVRSLPRPNVTIPGSYCTEEEQRDDDSDNICGNDDSCIFDNANDADSDMICGDVDSCPHDTENDTENYLSDCRGICRTSVDCRGDCDGSYARAMARRVLPVRARWRAISIETLCPTRLMAAHTHNLVLTAKDPANMRLIAMASATGQQGWILAAYARVTACHA